MRKFKLFFVFLFMAAGTLVSNAQQVDAAYRAELVKFLQMADMQKSFKDVLNTQFQSMKQYGLSDVKISAMADELSAELWPIMEGIYVDVYSKYFTYDEFKQLMKFYETPVGLKALKMMAPIMNDTQQRLNDDPRFMQTVQTVVQKYM